MTMTTTTATQQQWQHNDDQWRLDNNGDTTTNVS